MTAEKAKENIEVNEEFTLYNDRKTITDFIKAVLRLTTDGEKHLPGKTDIGIPVDSLRIAVYPRGDKGSAYYLADLVRHVRRSGSPKARYLRKYFVSSINTDSTHWYNLSLDESSLPLGIIKNIDQRGSTIYEAISIKQKKVTGNPDDSGYYLRRGLNEAFDRIAFVPLNDEISSTLADLNDLSPEDAFSIGRIMPAIDQKDLRGRLIAQIIPELLKENPVYNNVAEYFGQFKAQDQEPLQL